ncbi:helix-turn-helix domain-containing protein [Kiloniella sp. b19]|uniref:helix-turn-helix domain-containing protein n=1 Tax=Kiloniella sp. GXU_MW_B19 TaxID=3141326 RepID=UPI0031D6A5BC
MEQINRQLSQRLKSLRKDKGWSLDRAAQETGVSKAMLGQIERQESCPTLATLWKISDGFHCPLSLLLDPVQREENPALDKAVFRSVQDTQQKPTQDAMLVAPLFPYDPAFGFEVMTLTMPPGYERLSEPHDTGVVEQIVMISGTAEILTDGSWTSLSEGTAVRFPADRPHGYRNSDPDKSAIFNLLIFYGSGPR